MTNGVTDKLGVKDRILSSAVYKRGEKFTAGRMASQVRCGLRRTKDILRQMVQEGGLRRYEDSRGEGVYGKATNARDLVSRPWVSEPSPSYHISEWAR